MLIELDTLYVIAAWPVCIGLEAIFALPVPIAQFFSAINGSTERMEPMEPTERAERTQRTERTERMVRMEPMARMVPTEPMERTERMEQMTFAHQAQGYFGGQHCALQVVREYRCQFAA